MSCSISSTVRPESLILRIIPCSAIFSAGFMPRGLVGSSSFGIGGQRPRDLQARLVTG